MVRPRNNLPPESQPWSRAIENELQQTQRNSIKALEDNTNAFNGLNSTMNRVSLQIATIAAQQVTLTEQQVTLATQQATLTELVALQLAVDGNSQQGSNFTLVNPPTFNIAAQVTLTKPAWATKALVTATGTGYLVSSNQYVLPHIGIVIAGHAGMIVEMSRTENASTYSFSTANVYTIKLDPAPTSVVCQVGFYADAASLFLTGAANRIAQINATAIFTR